MYRDTLPNAVYIIVHATPEGSNAESRSVSERRPDDRRNAARTTRRVLGPECAVLLAVLYSRDDYYEKLTHNHIEHVARNVCNFVVFERRSRLVKKPRRLTPQNSEESK